MSSHLQRNGFYVDSGAYDGETAANSLFFERNRGWNGLLVEMDPYFYTMLRSKNRNAHSINACLSPRKSPIQVRTPYKGGGAPPRIIFGFDKYSASQKI